MDLEQTKYMRELRRSISKHFSEEDLQMLAFDLSVDWDDLNGNGKSLKIQSLIMKLARNKRLDDLVRLIHEERPNTQWPSIVSPDQQAKDEKMLIPDSEREKELQEYLSRMHEIITRGLGRGMLQSFDNFVAVSKETSEQKNPLPTQDSLSTKLLARISPKPNLPLSIISKNIQQASNTTVATARAYTQAVIPRLDPKRLQIVIRYLSEIELPELITMDDEDLSGLDFSSLKLTGADFGMTNLRNANFTGTDLTCVDLSRSKLEGAVLSGAIFNDETQWPSSIDPVAYGAVLIEKNEN